MEGWQVVSWEPKGTPPRNKALIFGLIKGNQPMVDNPFIRPYVLGGYP